MKRKLFFFLEKLQISKSERISVSVLMVMVFCTGFLTLLWSPNPQYSEEEYANLEKIFNEKSREIKQNRDLILARYEPLRNGNEEFMPVEQTEMVLNDTLPPPEDESEMGLDGSLININLASASKLQELPGIGPAYSKRIVEWRNQNGRFTSIDQLIEIKGIGEKRLASIKPLITL